MERNKYYLFSSKSCPYAHRCEIAVRLLGFGSAIQIVYCDPIFTFKEGWKIISNNNPTKYTHIKELYEESKIDAKYFSLPVLYDNSSKRIVSTESLDIIKLLNGFSESKLSTQCNYQKFFDEFNETIVVGTYKAGHAKTQEEYEKYFTSVFDYLDQFENFLNGKQYVIDNVFSIMDIVVYCHLIRFDLVFYDLFALNGKHLWEYDNICRYLNNLSSIPAFKLATDIDNIKRGAYLTENNLPQNLGCVKVPVGYGGVEYYY